MTQQTIEQRIIALLPGDSLTAETEFTALALDSLEFLQFIKFMEAEFEVEIPDEKIVGLNKIGDVVALVKHLIAAQISA